MELRDTRPGAEDRRRGRRITLWTVFWLCVAVAVVWAVWGFRWPPTVATITGASAVPDVETTAVAAVGSAIAAPVTV